MTAVQETLLEAMLLVVLVIIVFLQSWRAAIIPIVAIPVSLIGTFAVLAGARLLAQHPVDVRPGAGHRHRRRRRHRRGRECRAEPRAWHDPARSRAPLDGRGLDRAGRDRPRAVRGVRADHLPHRHHRRILSPVRGDDRQLDDHFAAAVADPFAGARRAAAEAEERPSRGSRRDGRASTAPGDRFNDGFAPAERMVRQLHPPDPACAEARAGDLCRARRADRRRVRLHPGGLRPGAGPGLCARRDPASARKLDRAHRRGAQEGRGQAAQGARASTKR